MSTPHTMPSRQRRLRYTLTLAAAALVAAVVAPGPSHAQGPPPAPMNVQAAEGGGWQPHPSFHVSWDNPAVIPPVVAAHYELCGPPPFPGPTECHTHTADGLSETVVTVPRPGIFMLQVWLEDEDGNGAIGGANQKSVPLALQYDDGTPLPPRLAGDGGWLNAEQAASYDLIVEMDPFGPIPISFIRGYRVSLGDLAPDDESPEIPATLNYLNFPGTYELTNLAEGITQVRMTSISYAGNASSQVGSGSIKVDRSPPTVVAQPAPSPGIWQRSETNVALVANDQPGLSGMTAAPGGEAVQEGGHISYRHNGGPLQRVRGDRAEVMLSADGHHNLTYQAFDAAGNSSVGREATVMIDRTPPKVAFAPRQPLDPRALVANVSDTASGIAGGGIEIRRVGGGEWQALPTILHTDRRLHAQIDDRLPKGRYELRAQARDKAGNVAWANSSETGTAMMVTLPVREATSTTTAVRPHCRAKPRKLKAKRSNGAGTRSTGRRRRAAKCPRRGALRKSSSVRLTYGQPVAVSGQLRTAAGEPVAGATVLVESRLRAGSAWIRHATRRTSRSGTFSYKLARGSSRQVRYSYAGNATLLPSSSLIRTKVRAALTLRPSARQLVNGETVVFHGRLRGKPIPKAGKAILLQARVGKRWRTFATPRANRRGLFRQSYRFTSTTGLRSYRFRAVALPEAAYRYSRGQSRTVTVVVRGQ